MGRQDGFTLIEIIFSLVIVGIAATVGGMAIVTAMRGFVFTKENAVITQKAQVALSRLDREMMEIMDVSAAASDSITYQKPAGFRSIALVGNLLKIVDGTTLPSSNTGDVLIDRVASIQFQYFKGPSTWTQGTDSIQLLSGIRINLVMTRTDPGVSNPTFTTTVTPRNNRNFGGAAPTVTPPSRAGYCFVATAAYGTPHHPAVELLRQFRDVTLSGWSGGRALIEAYYSIGPKIAELIRVHPLGSLLARFFLAPFVLLAFMMLTFPAGIPLFLLLLLGICRLSRAMRSRGTGAKAVHPVTGDRGVALISLVLAIVLLSTLAAVMLPLTTTSTFQQITGNNAMRSYFLAESGYRFAASEYLNAGNETAKDDKLEALHSQTFTLSGNDGKFLLIIYPYYYRTTSDPNGSAAMATRVPGGFPTGLTLSSGYLKVNNVVHQYSNASVSGSNVTFTRASGTWPSITAGKVVYPVTRPNGTQTVTDTSHNYIDLESTTGSANALPSQNCAFRIEGQVPSVVYAYTKRVGTQLTGITRTDNSSASFSFSVTGTTNIVAEKFIQLHSTGILNQGGALETKREVTYDVPIGYVAAAPPTEKITVVDNMDSLGNWFTGRGQGELGAHSIVSVSGSNAMRVTAGTSPAVFGSAGYWSLISFNWGPTMANLDTAWRNAGYLLSYDLQVKIKATDEPYFMAGINFRTQTSGSDVYTYGISFQKARQSRYRILGTWGSYNYNSDIPSALVPPALVPATFEEGPILGSWLLGRQDRYLLPGVVLWQRTSAGFKWLAYALLATTDYVVSNNASGYPRLNDWSNLQVRALEAVPLGFSNGGPTPPLWGETITGQTSGTIAIVNGTPILTSGAWNTNNAAGTLALYSVSGSFTSGENLTVGGQVRARTTGTQGARTNFIRAYIADTSSHGTLNNVPTDNNRGADPRITTSGQTVYWPVDDVSNWAAANDYMTLIQWDGVNTGVTRLGTGAEANAIIQDSSLLTPTSGTFTNAEIALHTAGGSSSADFPDVYFDDFAIQVLGAGGSSGFLPPIQQ